MSSHTSKAITPPAGMLISGRALISFALFLVLYTGLKGGYYFLANRMQELGFLSLLSLFAYSALVASLNVKERDLRWSWWVFSTLAFVGYTLVLPGFLFSQHTGVSMLPSVFASREFLIAFLSAALYFLYRIGYRVEDIERIFFITVIALVFSYLFHYFRLDLEKAFFSPNPTIAAMVSWDDWRGFRLKPPGIALQFGTIMSPYMIFTSRSLISRILWLLAFLICIWSWSVLMARSTIAMMVVGVILYHFWFAYRSRLPLFFLSLPVVIPAMTSVTINYFTMIESHDQVRGKAYSIALDTLSKYPLFGFGQESQSTLNEQQIFWHKFFSADIGILGIAFKYGIVGTLLYYCLFLFALQRAVRTNWLIRNRTGRPNIILIAFTAKGIGDLFKFVLSVDYVYIEGILSAAFIIALTSIYQHRFKQGRLVG